MSVTESVVQNGMGEDLGIAFLNSVVNSLNAALKDNGVGDRATREKVLSAFVFDFAMKLDQPDEITVNDAGFTPVLCFRSSDDESKLVYSTAFDYHDYAHANVFGALDAEEQGEP